MLQILFTGWVILLTAILTNYALKKTSWVGWYSYVKQLRSAGFTRTHQEVSIPNLVFLYVAYPLILGLASWMVT